MNGRIRVEATQEISYGHRLMFHQGKCRSLHGHNGKVTVTVEAPQREIPRDGMLLDFTTLGQRLKDTLEFWDHKTLLYVDDRVMIETVHPEMRVLLPVHPTAEELATMVFRIIEESFEQLSYIVVRSVRWQETSKYAATYLND